MIKTIVADDHALVRQGLALLLASAGGFALVAETAYGLQVEPLVRTHQPDLLLLDLALSDCSGLEVASRVKRALPSVKILVVTANVYPDAQARALGAGADGFVLKHAQGSELLEGIRTVLSGRPYIGSAATPSSTLPAVATPRQADDFRELTERERQIVRMIATGLPNQQIADTLHISFLTVRKHRQNIMTKLGLRNGAEVAAYALQNGLA